MSNYPIQHIQIFEKSFVEQGTFIWAFHVDKVPPHVGISIDGCYFSMKASEYDFNLDVEAVYQVVQRKKISTFLIAIKDVYNLEGLKSIFREYGTKIKEGESCMTPVLRFLGENEELLLDELLIHLFQTKRIDSVLGIHLPEQFNQLPYYTSNDVQIHIQQIKNVSR
jgi:hypothetical protein